MWRTIYINFVFVYVHTLLLIYFHDNNLYELFLKMIKGTKKSWQHFSQYQEIYIDRAVNSKGLSPNM